MSFGSPRLRQTRTDNPGKRDASRRAAADADDDYGPYVPARGPPPDMTKRALIFDSLQKVVSNTFQKEPFQPGPKAPQEPGFQHRGTYIWTWGAGYEDQLGPDPKELRGKSKCQLVPFQFSLPSPIRYVAAGGNATAALNDDGHLWLWGQTVFEFDITEKKDPNQPVFMNIPLVKVALSRGGIAGITQSGQLVYAGFLQSKCKELEPVPGVSHLQFVDVSCGDNHVAAVTKDGVLYTFGSSEHGQLGHGKSEGKSKSDESFPKAVDFSKSVSPGEKVFVTQVSCGSIHTACVTSKGEVFVFGFGENLLPGHDSFFYHPVKVHFPPPVQSANPLPDDPTNVGATSPNSQSEFIVQVACGHGHVVARTARGDVYCWGDGKEGQLGSNDSTKTPRLALAGKGIVQVAAGRYHTLALTYFGAVYAWGNGENGQLGLGKDYSKSTVPRVIESNLGAVIGLIACGEHHSVALSSTPWRVADESVREWAAIERQESDFKSDRAWIRQRNVAFEVEQFVQQRKDEKMKELQTNEEIIESEQRAINTTNEIRNRVFSNVLAQEAQGHWGGNTLTDGTKYSTLHEYYLAHLNDGLGDPTNQDSAVGSTGGYLDRPRTTPGNRYTTLPQITGASRPATSSSDQRQMAATIGSGNNALVESNNALLPTRSFGPSPVAVHSQFLRETNALVADMKATVAQTLDAPADMRLAYTWVTSRRQLYDSLKTEAARLERQLTVLTRQVQTEARAQLALVQMHEAYQKRKNQLEMRLDTAQIQIRETTQNMKNYNQNITQLNSVAFDSLISEKSKNQEIAAQDSKIRKYNEAKLRAIADRDRTQRELQAFANEVREYTKFMQDQLAAFRELHQKALDREAKRERAKQAKREAQMRARAEKIAELNREMAAKMELAQAKANSLKELNERLNFFKQRLQQITATTGLTDQDEIIRKFQLKEKLLQELEQEIKAKQDRIVELMTKERELKQRLLEHSRNSVECTWKDVERKEEELREANSHLTKVRSQVEQTSERLARLQEGIVALLSKLPENLAPRVDRDKEPLPLLINRPQEVRTVPRITNQSQNVDDTANKEYFLTLQDDRSMDSETLVEERTLDLIQLLRAKLSELSNQVHDRESEKRRRAAEEHERRSIEQARDFPDHVRALRR